MFEYLEKLNPSQYQAATHLNGPLLIIAGAGSGKTTVLINRVAYMVDNQIPPGKILLLTFTNAAANNMKTRATKLSNPDCQYVTACTYHSFCADILRQFHTFVGLRKDFTIMTPHEELEAFKLCKSELGYGKLKDFPSSKDLMKILSESCNKMIRLSDLLDANENFCMGEITRSAVDHTFLRLTSYKQENHLLSYDDLLLKTEQLVRNPEVCAQLEQTYQYVMVDEYQDTNKIQEKIVFALTKTHRNLVVVGDAYQSIYKFRGSDIKNILEFPQRVGGCNVVTIDTNYRSNKEILDVANEVMDAHAHFGKKQVMKDAGNSGLKVTFSRPGNQEDEANQILKSIKQWQADGKNLSEYAVLERNSKSSSLLEIKLTKEGIPFEKLGGLKFLDHACIQDYLAFLKVIANPDDELGWFHLLDILPGIGEVYAHRVMNDVKKGTLERPDAPWAKKSFFADLQALITFAKQTRVLDSFSDIFDAIHPFYFAMREKKIAMMIVKDEEKRNKETEQMNNDKETVAILKEISNSYDSLIAFLDSIVLDANIVIPSEGKVIISTIHSSKGMEWEHVDILDCMDGILPKDKINKEECMEDLRCFYVALTRAKIEEVIYAPNSVIVNGKSTSDISPFLDTCICKNLFQMDAFTHLHAKSNAQVKCYLNVDYHEKDRAKSLGARWDGLARCWYIPEGHPNQQTLLQLFG